jgi:hypothetical protein
VAPEIHPPSQSKPKPDVPDDPEDPDVPDEPDVPEEPLVPEVPLLPEEPDVNPLITIEPPVLLPKTNSSLPEL